MAVSTFETPRLIAERLNLTHLQGLTEIHLDPEVSLHLGGVRSAAETDTYLRLNMAHWEQHGFGLWAIKTKTGDFAGRAGIRKTVVDDEHEVEIAYTFARHLWGQGLASEIVTRLLDIARDDLSLTSIIGIVELGNLQSCHVLDKAGFQMESTTIYNGQPVYIYRIRFNAD